MRRLEGTIRAYPWGSRTMIPRLRGQDPDSRPQAELWYGAHPAAPSGVDGSTLDQVIAQDPVAALGGRVSEEYEGKLPFLLKLLAADQPLSLQAHPSLAQAREGFARENDAGIDIAASNRNYRDDNHKPELLVALTPFYAMAGFRPLAQTRELFAKLGSPEADRYLTMMEGDDEASGLRALFTTWITIPGTARNTLIDSIVEHAIVLAKERSWAGQVGKTVIDLHERYPYDAGILGALLLNHIHLDPGEAVYLGAGQLHAYVHGLGVEIMANSDNVLRGGLTSKHVDVPELVRVLKFEPLSNPVVRADDVGEYHTPAPEFMLNKVDLGLGEFAVDHDGPSIIMCTSGHARVDTGRECEELAPGDAAWIPASDPAAVACGEGTVFWART